MTTTQPNNESKTMFSIDGIVVVDTIGNIDATISVVRFFNDGFAVEVSRHYTERAAIAAARRVFATIS